MADPIELVLNVPALEADIASVEERIELALYKKTEYLTHLFAERVRQNLSGQVLQKKSGALFDSVLEHGPTNTGDAITSEVTAGGDTAPYGIVHEEGGQKEYMIYPVNKKALMFEIGGKQIFAASVRHPPMPQRSWFGVVADEMESAWGDELEAAVGEALA